LQAGLYYKPLMLAPSPVVSIVMPVYNMAAYLPQAVDSVRTQTLPNWELIIADDASTDASLAIAKKYAARDPRIHVLSLPVNSRGAARPRNAALDHTNGRYVAFLDADDIWLPQKLERQISFMQAHDCAISQTAYRLITPDGHPSNRVYHPAPVVTHDYHIRRRNMGMNAMIDRHKTGPFRFDENAPVEDFDLFLRLLKNHDAHGLDEELYLYRRGHPSLSAGRLRMMFNIVQSTAYTRHQLGLARCAYSFAVYAAGVVARRLARFTPPPP
jgi:teichuronic acid biosynthesis glycosyltransferase TuaG